MRIENDKIYEVKKYKGDSIYDFGFLEGTEVRKMLKNYDYDENYEMWFSKKATIGYDISEVE